MPFALLMPLAQRGAALALLIGGGVVVSAGIVASNVIGATFLQTSCPPAMLGRVSGATRMVNFGTLPFGALTLSPLILLISPLSRLRDLPSAHGEQ